MAQGANRRRFLRREIRVGCDLAQRTQPVFTNDFGRCKSFLPTKRNLSHIHCVVAEDPRFWRVRKLCHSFSKMKPPVRRSSNCAVSGSGRRGAMIKTGPDGHFDDFFTAFMAAMAASAAPWV
jgi:hypothetical protein